MLRERLRFMFSMRCIIDTVQRLFEYFDYTT